MNALIASGSVLAACLVFAWAFAIRNHVRAKDMYVELFTNTAIGFLGRGDFDDRLKAFLVSISAGIQSAKVADYVAQAVAGGSHANGTSEIVDLMNGANSNPTEEQFHFLGAVFLYLMALSFSSSSYGGRMRKRLRAELPNKHALLEESRRAHFANSSLSVDGAMAAA